MQIDCPWCGSRDLREFTYMGDASRKIPRLSDSEDTWATYVYERPNPRGPHAEFWQHTFGCRQFLRVVRDTVTHDIHSVEMAGPHAETTR